MKEETKSKESLPTSASNTENQIPTSHKVRHSRYRLISAKEIQVMEIPPIEWIVENFLSAGLTIIAGRPKVGKSFFCMNLALSIMEYFNVMKSEVVYFALEDHHTRIQSRINKIIEKKTEATAPENFHFLKNNQDFLKLNEGGIKELQRLLLDYPNIKLIIIDTLGRSRADQGRRDNNIYLADYDLLAQLQTFALSEKICVLLVHHTKKSEEENVFDEISGTTGITGAADTNMVLKKVKDEYKLFVTGRDIPETEYQLMFDDTTCSWNVTGEEMDSRSLTAEREEVLTLLSERNEPIKTGEIAQALEKETSNVSKLLKKLFDDRLIISPKYGYYQLPPEIKKETLHPNETKKSTQSDQSG